MKKKDFSQTKLLKSFAESIGMSLTQHSRNGCELETKKKRRSNISSETAARNTAEKKKIPPINE